ncbi:hypothetical protein IV203_012193 [Nitzschia inconspicua]|uniref:Uncharacterized protein n=1 Tax=Nitzschia inconspicua TaxID=303405 RepID=A0A9K3KU37_9STRA|nr:hypothetical protein IV203_012193 [Nitzschia inconspicua]
MPAPSPAPSSPAIEDSPHSSTPIGATQSADRGPRSFEVRGINLATEPNTDAGLGMEPGPTKESGPEQDPILGVQRQLFRGEVLLERYGVRIRGRRYGGYQRIPGIFRKHSVHHENAWRVSSTKYKPKNYTVLHSGAKVVFSKVGHCLKKGCKELARGIVSTVAAHKHGPPTAMGVMKAGAHKKKTHLRYHQFYRVVQTWKDSKEISDPMSFQLLGSYVERFREQNPGSRAIVDRGNRML